MLLDRMFAKTVITSTNCWEWTGCRHSKGYGRIKIDGKAKATHKVGYELFKGKVPEGLVLLHSCDNPPCWNPSHLTAGTHQENMNDMVAKGRSRGNHEAASTR